MHFAILIAATLLAIVQPISTKQRVHDFANLLSAEQRQSLEQLSRDVEDKTTAQITVVTVQSLDGKTVESYANELFNNWGIGSKQFNNGVLFLVAPKERRLRFEVGRGVEPLLTDSLCGEIRDKNVIPYFKRNNYAEGIVVGTHRLATVLLADPTAARGDPNSAPVLARIRRRDALWASGAVGVVAIGLTVLAGLVAIRRLYSTTAFTFVSAVAGALIAIAGFMLWRTPRVEQPLSLFGGATAATIAAWGYNLKRYRRFGPHGCSKCGTQLRLLSELEEDPKLSAVQQLEEKIGSVDYDVWVCPACLNNDTERYIKPFSRFTECPKCRARTFKEDDQQVIRPATTLMSGLAQVEGRCVNCNYKSVREVILPVLPAPSTWSSSNSSSGSSFGSGGSFGGGFSSGGGGFSGGGSDFGGGSSGGGGASGGW